MMFKRHKHHFVFTHCFQMELVSAGSPAELFQTIVHWRCECGTTKVESRTGKWSKEHFE